MTERNSARRNGWIYTFVFIGISTFLHLSARYLLVNYAQSSHDPESNNFGPTQVEIIEPSSVKVEVNQMSPQAVQIEIPKEKVSVPIKKELTKSPSKILTTSNNLKKVEISAEPKVDAPKKMEPDKIEVTDSPKVTEEENQTQREEPSPSLVEPNSEQAEITKKLKVDEAEEVEEAEFRGEAPLLLNPEGEVQEQAESITETQVAGDTQGTSDENSGKPAFRSNTELKQLPGNIPPTYPLLARQKAWEGTVGLTYFVSADGRVTQIKIQRSSGFDILDKEAVRAVSLFRYQPGQEGITTHRVTFMLTPEKSSQVR